MASDLRGLKADGGGKRGLWERRPFAMICDFSPVPARTGGHVLANVLSSAVLGIDAYRVEVEVDITSGLPSFSTVGLPEASVKESKERVKSAIANSGYRFPDDRITVNLAPADIKKEGTGFDLPIALGILAATGIIPQQALARYLILGELSLDGRVKPVKGSLPMAMSAQPVGASGHHRPARERPEAAVVGDIEVLPVRTLSEVVEFLSGQSADRPGPRRSRGRCSTRTAGSTRTSPTCAARSMPSGRWRSPRPAATTSS